MNQDDNHDVVNSPVIGSVPDIADINHGLLDGAAVENITGVQEHEYEQAPYITHFNCLLQSMSQQLRLQDDKINELEARINHLQDWQNRVLFTNIKSWPLCTSVGGDDFFGDISPVQTDVNEEMRKKKRNRRTWVKVLMVVMIKNSIRERVVGMIAMSLQPSLKQKGGGHLL